LSGGIGGIGCGRSDGDRRRSGVGRSNDSFRRKDNVTEISGAEIVVVLGIAPVENFLPAGSGVIFIVLLNVKTNGEVRGCSCI